MRYYSVICYTRGIKYIGPYNSLEEIMEVLNTPAYTKSATIQSRSVVIKDV